MTSGIEKADPHLAKFGIGQSAKRVEDDALLRGEGRYTDDLNAGAQVYAAMVRSPRAHGLIRSIGIEAALSRPGVLAVYTGADLAAAGFGTMPPGVSLPNHDGTPMHWSAWRAVPVDRVRHLGEPVAFVVANSAAAANDAAELVEIDIDPLPAVTMASTAVAEGAPLVHPEIPGNVAVHYRYGDRDKVAAAFASAAHVTRLEITNSRIIVNPMEPRSAFGSYDAATGIYTLNSATQGVFGSRNLAADAMGIAHDRLRVLTGNVGGSFGMKAHPYPEDLCVLFAAKALGRPVKWTDTRSASFMSDTHGRAHEMVNELALDAEGRFLALRLTGLGNLGAYLTQGGIIPVTINATKNAGSVYRTPLIEVDTRCVYTHTTPVGAYRGNGRPETNYYVERLIDVAADEMGIDPAELRRRNHIRPDQLPYRAPSGVTYDSGDFPAVLERALELADWSGFEHRRAESRARNRLRGRGIGQFLEVTAIPGNETGGIRFESDGAVTIITGTMDNGQGHASAFAQVVVSTLGIPFDRIKLLQGDSDELRAGAGTGGSKSLMASGSAFVEASAKVIEKGRKLAGHFLETAEADIEFALGRFVVAGTDRSIGVLDLAERLRAMPDLPEDVPSSLDVDHVFLSGASTFPNGCHVAEVEIDPDTGVVQVVAYTSVNDFGTLINPMIVEGQCHGGIAQGIGQALMEQAIYDEAGQLLSGSFMDYAMPRAADVPDLGFVSHPRPALTNVLGAKGCGEAGCAGSLPAVMNAVIDALADLGVRHVDMPATPERIWRAIRAAGDEAR